MGEGGVVEAGGTEVKTNETGGLLRLGGSTQPEQTYLRRW